METHIANAFDIDGYEVQDDDILTSLQKVRMEEARATCPRCKQGFCATHGTKLGAYTERPPWTAMTQLPDEELGGGASPVEAPDSLDTDTDNTPETLQRVCKNQCCGKRFTDEENTSLACHYHRGPISFSDRSTEEHKWVCCEASVSSFEELATIPPCTRGKHYAPPDRK
ncbi:cysteine and histidine-rich domain-containing protein RAR1 [Physcomitrium patens]|uniref:cysteine and histidine-rich domain-containing protein RAR1 n=1 Tax=Physcomitrium patens TaxID=3218 RepID=UPI000D17D562|nr:cysteine and histidine-rich domain-containing protein RAR1-like isoform X3 [Physcomitrium patens]XP_024377693.1 cysteine and histidine-rich domain-containing protein RAR1-like isoform X3 [Physcomitrium patens]XP_024377694.1 cysteine and histidine-rich domain-containing protein RAR1-like isoform X3 [Physcomitrium patens]XP_024377695.1 cysteine and histidine-rich domain-containing protein RAR1-like isoform X3 [Physcomitrium patens]|eukprot:XP_024377691.1 cysteine and histidine-rich domain-containing protein RAR1-like isoform X3 [Physcomitrella patens]